MLWILAPYTQYGNSVKVNTDKKKIKGAGANAGQIMVATSVNGKIKAEWTDFTVDSAQITDGSISSSDLAEGALSSYFVVDDNAGVGNFTSIQEAIDQLQIDGGKIFIQPGTYNENITISQSNIILVGSGIGTIINGAITASNTNNLIIQDLQINNAVGTGIGITLYALMDSKIIDCTIQGTTGSSQPMHSLGGTIDTVTEFNIAY